MKRGVITLIMAGLLGLAVFALWSCGDESPNNTLEVPWSVPPDTVVDNTPIEADPTLMWDLVTTDCIGNPLVGSVTYHIYVLAGPGPIPTVQEGMNEVPCGIVLVADLTRITPYNDIPIVAPPYQVFVADGVYTFAVEAVGQNGARSGLSIQITRTVRSRPGIPPLDVS